MSNYKCYEVQNLSKKYGSNMCGFVALQDIEKGQVIFQCDKDNCMYKDSNTRFNRTQIDQILEKHPEKSDYFHRYFYMLGDDIYGVPKYYETMEITCECPFVNHCCDPNCEYKTSENQYKLIASRNIRAGEELCLHYGAHDTETSLIVGLNCQCGSSNCVGILLFNDWRNPSFQEKYFHCMSNYVQGKVNQLKEEQSH